MFSETELQCCFFLIFFFFFFLSQGGEGEFGNAACRFFRNRRIKFYLTPAFFFISKQDCFLHF